MSLTYAIAALGFAFLSLLLLTLFTSVIQGLRKFGKEGLQAQFLDMLDKYKFYFAVFLSAFAVVSLFFPNMVVFNRTLESWILFALLAGLGKMGIDLADLGLEFYSEEIAPRTKTKVDDEILPMAKNLVKITLYSLLILFLLTNLGIDIGPLLAGMGIGGLAVALALQDTLTNFFSGIHIIADRPLRVGDYIKINDIEGRVLEIGWRTTRILTLDKNIVVFPNKDLANSVIVNYSRPIRALRHSFMVSVAYGTKVEKVKKIAQRIFKAMEKEKLIQPKPEPVVRLQNLGDYGLEFKIILTVPNFLNRFSAQEYFLEQFYKACEKEGIEIPFPTHTVYVKR